MAQPLSRAEAITLLTTGLDGVYENTGTTSSPTYPKVVNVETMERGQEVNYRIAGIGPHTQRADFENITFDQYEFGELQTVVPNSFGIGMRMSKEVIDDLAAKPYGDFEQLKLAGYGEITKRFRRSATRTIELRCAAMFLNSTSTAAAYIGRDGLALLSASHVTLKNPPVTWSNLQTQASMSPVQVLGMRTALQTIPDDTGDYTDDADGFKLVYAPYNDIRAIDMLNTKGQVDSNNNNTNPLNRFNITPVCWKYLGPTHKGFYLLENGRHTMRYLERQKPEFEREGDFQAVAQMFRSTFRGVPTTKDPHGVIGNLGL